MAITVGMFAESGQGKTTSVVINPDGKTIYLPEGHPNKAETYEAMDPKSTIIINSDRKALPFPSDDKWILNKNVFWESDVERIKQLLIKANSVSAIKSIYIDTINGIMVDKEMNDIKRKSYDKWADLAQQIYDLITFCNHSLRPDIVVYMGGHVTMYTDVDGNESKCLITNGRKLEKIKLETKLPIVLFSAVERGLNGEHKYMFETQYNRSTAKSPIGMFSDFNIPNSLKLIDTTIRNYYGI